MMSFLEGGSLLGGAFGGGPVATADGVALFKGQLAYPGGEGVGLRSGSL